MATYTRIARGALRLAGAGWVAAGLAGCAPTAIDTPRLNFTAAQAAARAAAEAELSLVHNQTYHELNLKSGAESRPAAFHGTFQQAHQRWVDANVRKLPVATSGTTSE